MKAVWTDPASGCPRTPQQPHPPLLIGGNGERLLRLAATEGDIVGFAGFSPRRGGTRNDLSRFSSAGLAARVALVREAAGERFDQLELSGLVQRVVVTDDRQQAAEDMSKEWSGALSAEQLLDCPFLLIGSHDEIVDEPRGPPGDLRRHLLDDLRELLGAVRTRGRQAHVAPPHSLCAVICCGFRNKAPHKRGRVR